MKKSSYGKKGNAINFMKTFALALGIAFIIASVVALILDRFDDNLTGAPLAVVSNGTLGVLELAGFGTTFGVVGAVVIIIGLVAMIKLKR